MNRDQLIAHLALHGWRPVAFTYLEGICHAEYGLCYRYGGRVQHAGPNDRKVVDIGWLPRPEMEQFYEFVRKAGWIS